jgi:nicotinamide riboside transporter PnuC
MSWLLTILSITGVILNTYKNKWCFVIWLITNISWSLYNLYHKMYSQSFLFFVYFMLAIYGLIKWSKDGKVEK